MIRHISLIYIIVAAIALSCESPNPNIDDKGKDALASHEVKRDIATSDMAYEDIIYVPIYSDIYVDPSNQSSLLAATLSIRNTSDSDSLFISTIEYYNTNGNLVRSYLDNPISLSPMGTINYVIEKDDDTGGPGANFIVGMSSKNKDAKPLVQAIMIGESGNKGFAFSTDGYSVK